ncbi:uncharacterized protein [Montipora capricornis]|uniref:uncharacterized protein n=1 Tax=Montipora capricornis TaxID=246305 RepID=UPI0035F137A4
MARLTILCLVCLSILSLSSAGKNSCKRPKKIRSVFLKPQSCDCDSKTSGLLKYEDGQVLFCNGNDWKSLMTSVGSMENPGSSCKDIKERSPTEPTNGVYWIITGSQGAIPVYCDMKAGGWTMVFKYVNDTKQDAYEVYNSADTYSENQMEALDVTKAYPDIYKNKIVLKWSSFDPSEARVALYKGGSLVKELMFDAKGTDKLNWFAKSKLTGTLPWNDIEKETTNYFAIEGDPGNNRRFFINRSYGGCPNDMGWMVVSKAGCEWEKAFGEYVILYSNKDTYVPWQQELDNVAEADVIAVFVR